MENKRTKYYNTSNSTNYTKTQAGIEYGNAIVDYNKALIDHTVTDGIKEAQAIKDATDTYLRYEVSNIVGPINNYTLTEFSCPKGEYVNAIVGNHIGWINQIGIECTSGNSSGNNRSELHDSTRSSGNSSSDRFTNIPEPLIEHLTNDDNRTYLDPDTRHTFNSDFKVKKYDGFNEINAYYGTVGMSGIRIGNHNIGSDFEPHATHVDLNTLKCTKGKISGIIASSGEDNLVNRLGIICDTTLRTPDTDTSSAFEGTTYES